MRHYLHLTLAPLLAAAPPVPSPVQLAHHGQPFYGFVHFGINTFTDREWGLGDEPPARFDPSAFDADQIASTFQAAGMSGLILTAKHHDGFCLWPSKLTDHTVARSPWRGGKGDVVKELAEACRRHGLAFGVYLSPWDRHHPDYGKPEYLAYYRAQLKELLTQYGPLFEVWFDGANGGDGCYGGKLEKRTIDPAAYYDWPTTWAQVRRLQPGAAIFSDVGPDLRWVGNEKGIAGDPCWATYSPKSADGRPAMPGFVLDREGTEGHRDGQAWMPAEADVSIRPGWFWHASEDGKVKPPAELRALYLQTVGRGAHLNLNVPPDRRGRLADPDVASLRAFGQWLKGTFAVDLAQGAAVTREASGVSLRFPQPASFNLVRLKEDLRQGQRVDAWVLEVRHEGAWRSVAQGPSIGACRLVALPETATGDLRVRVLKASGQPSLEVGCFREAPIGR